MYFFLHPSFPDLCQRIFFPPSILFTALYFSNVCYKSVATRWTTLLMLLTTAAASFRHHEIASQPAAYLMGFSVMWTVVYGTVLILFRNPSREFKRIRRLENKALGVIEYHWEPFPHDLSRRFYWVLDLIFNPRGLGWSHQSRKKLDSAPIGVKALYLDEFEKTKNPVKNGLENTTPTYFYRSKSSNSQEYFTSTKSIFLRQRLTTFFRNIVIFDILSYLVSIDPFLNGTGELNPFKVESIGAPRCLGLLFYRTALGLGGCYIVIDLFFTLISLIDVGVFGVGIFGTWGEPWMYPPHWGKVDAIYEQGIAGFWGSFWHDLLSYGLVAFSSGILGIKPTTLSKRLTPKYERNTLRLLLVFVISSLIHTAGSYIQSNDTYPILTFMAFSLQGIGITLQEVLKSLLAENRVAGSTAKIVVLITTFIWAILTFPLLLIDMALGQMTTTKVLPFNLTEMWFRRQNLAGLSLTWETLIKFSFKDYST